MSTRRRPFFPPLTTVTPHAEAIARGVNRDRRLASAPWRIIRFDGVVLAGSRSQRGAEQLVRVFAAGRPPGYVVVERGQP